MRFKKKIDPKRGDLRTRNKFAFFPVRCERVSEDSVDGTGPLKEGDLLWLERYVVVEMYKYNDWETIKIESRSQHFLDGLAGNS